MNFCASPDNLPVIPRSEPMEQDNSEQNSKLTSEKDHKILELVLITM